MEETDLGVFKVLPLIQVDSEEKISRNWDTCLLFKLFLGTAVSSWQRKTPGEMDFLIFLELFPKEKNTFWKSKCFISTCQLKSDLFYNWVNFSLQKTLKKGFISQQMKHSMFSSCGVFGFFPLLESKTDIFVLRWRESSLFLFWPQKLIVFVQLSLRKELPFFPMLSNLLLKENKEITAMA